MFPRRFFSRKRDLLDRFQKFFRNFCREFASLSVLSEIEVGLQVADALAYNPSDDIL